MNATERIAVVLFQLGGPDSPEAVEPFLYNLFCDPDIIDFPGAFIARKPLAKFISSKRSKKVTDHYRDIGGKSPILDLSRKQAAELQQQLDGHIQSKIFLAMRYWHPLTGEVVAEIQKDSFQIIILLPLYPQYSRTTTGSSINEWNRECQRNRFQPKSIETILKYHDHPSYIEALVDNVNNSLKKISVNDPRFIDIVFSAHGLPKNLIDAGDPYQKHIEETVQSVTKLGKWSSPHRLCYQSKVGPGEWLKPSLDNTIRELAQHGRKHLLIVPISFVTEHIETLHEINIEARELAKKLGIQQFEMMAALNDHPKFIQCLKELVLSKV